MEELDDILDYEEKIQDPKEFLVTKNVRFANYLVDYIFLVVIQVAFILGTGFLEGEADDTWISLASYIFLPVYYIVFEGLFGKSPGKFVTRTKVVMTDGSKPSLGKIIGRSFARLVPFEAFSFLGSEPTGWHDRWTDTRVVNDNF